MAATDAQSNAAAGGPDRAPVRRYVAYYRMSTDKQAQIGLSLKAQRESVGRYIAVNPGQLIAEYAETKSGRKSERPKLAEALYACRIFRAVLLIARLDRLARNVATIAQLMESKVDFVAVDFPHANRFTLHILAAIAEHESRLMSERMKSIIAARRAGGQRWIPPSNGQRCFPPGSQAASARVRRARSEARARDLAPLIWKAIGEGKSHAMIAEEFNRRGVRPPRDVPWGKNSIGRIARQTRDEFGVAHGTRARRPAGKRRANMLARLNEVGALLVEWRRHGMTYEAMSSELRRRGCAAPRNGAWSQASMRRYLMRAMNVPALRTPCEARA
jgi:DNA invertase Pin-like site-specific DNA recombinase